MYLKYNLTAIILLLCRDLYHIIVYLFYDCRKLWHEVADCQDLWHQRKGDPTRRCRDRINESHLVPYQTGLRVRVELLVWHM